MKLGYLAEDGAHPRSRGENFWLHCRQVTRAGSSPLTRGKPQHVAGDRLRDGLIPAHAGKTHGDEVPPVAVGAHPRSRGENWLAGEAWALEAGSSPLTRGKPVVEGDEGVGRGLIPAHAGKTVCPFLWLLMLWAHPRSRGENKETT